MDTPSEQPTPAPVEATEPARVAILLTQGEESLKDVFLDKPRNCAYNFVAKKVKEDEDFALYTLGVKVILTWDSFFEAYSSEDLFEVIQSSKIIDTFDRDEYQVTVKRTLPHKDYAFPDTLELTLHLRSVAKFNKNTVSGFIALSEEDFKGIEEEDLARRTPVAPKPPAITAEPES